MAQILMVIAHEGFRDEEYFEPKQILENAGHTIATTSMQSPAISSVEKVEVTPDILFEDIELEAVQDNYDVILFVGGPGAPIYAENKTAHQMAWNMYNGGKLVTAICIAPVILANAGLLIGKKATVWPGAKEQLCSGNCIYTPEDVVTDGRIITANGPNAATSFGEKILEKLESL